MKAMKYFFMAALALMTVACSNDNDIPTAPQPQKTEGITITATLAPKTDGTTRAVADNGDDKITVTWAKNEHLAILYEVGGEKKVADAKIIAVSRSGTATISFTVDGSTADNTQCTLVYPLSAAKADNTGVKAYADLLAAQDGTLNANLDVRVGEAVIRTDVPSLDVTTQPAPQFAIFKFTLSEDAEKVYIRDASGNLLTKVTPAEGYKSVMYVALDPVNTTLDFTVMNGDGAYIAQKTAAEGAIMKGMFYQVPISLTKLDDRVVVLVENPWNTEGELIYDIPEGAEIISAGVYVNVYSGSGANTYGANSKVTLTTDNGLTVLGNEVLWYDGNTMGDATEYSIYGDADTHVTKCYSDYQMYYDIKDELNDLEGTSIKINVKNTQINEENNGTDEKLFDGRIKMIALVIAFSGSTPCNYWINSTQRWAGDGDAPSVTTTFNTSGVSTFHRARLINIALSSNEPSYTVNNVELEPETHKSGNYYQYNDWDVTDKVIKGENTVFKAVAITQGWNGLSVKNALTVLVID